MYRANYPTAVIVHHTATSRDYTTFESINKRHEQRWPYFISELGYCIGYHYLITSDGVVHRGRIEEEGGAHTIGWNEKSIGICLTGNFMDEYPRQEQMVSLEKLIDDIRFRRGISRDRIFGHRQKGATLCPGTHLWKLVQKYQSKFITPEQKKAMIEQVSAMLEQLARIMDMIKNI